MKKNDLLLRFFEMYYPFIMEWTDTDPTTNIIIPLTGAITAILCEKDHPNNFICHGHTMALADYSGGSSTVEDYNIIDGIDWNLSHMFRTLSYSLLPSINMVTLTSSAFATQFAFSTDAKNMCILIPTIVHRIMYDDTPHIKATNDLVAVSKKEKTLTHHARKPPTMAHPLHRGSNPPHECNVSHNSKKTGSKYSGLRRGEALINYHQDSNTRDKDSIPCTIYFPPVDTLSNTWKKTHKRRRSPNFVNIHNCKFNQIDSILCTINWLHKCSYIKYNKGALQAFLFLKPDAIIEELTTDANCSKRNREYSELQNYRGFVLFAVALGMFRSYIAELRIIIADYEASHNCHISEKNDMDKLSLKELKKMFDNKIEFIKGKEMLPTLDRRFIVTIFSILIGASFGNIIRLSNYTESINPHVDDSLVRYVECIRLQYFRTTPAEQYE